MGGRTGAETGRGVAGVGGGGVDNNLDMGWDCPQEIKSITNFIILFITLLIGEKMFHVM